MVEIFLRGSLGGARRLHGSGVGLQRAQRVRDVLKGLHHRVAILRLGLIEGRLRGLLLVVEGHPVEGRLRDIASERIAEGSGLEELREGEGARRAIGGERHIRQARRDGDADQRARRMKIGLGALDVGALRDKL